MYLWHRIVFYCLIAFTVTSAVQPSPTNTTIAPTQTAQVGEKIGFNNYELIYCGDPYDNTSSASSLIRFLTGMKSQLELLTADAQLGTHSSRFTAFFKSNRNVPKVVAQLRNLIDGNPVIVAESRVRYAGSRTPQPKLVCLSESHPKAAASWRANCQNRPNQVMYAWGGTEAVMVCPRFFTAPWFPTDCPVLKGGKVGGDDDHMLLRGMYAFTVLQLVRLYDRGLRESEMNYGAAATMMQAIGLDSRDSVLSATNYACYAGGEFGVFLFFSSFAFLSLAVDELYKADLSSQLFKRDVRIFRGREGCLGVVVTSSDDG